MKTTADLVKGWISEADNDLENAQLCIASNSSLDTARFHTQQAAEKFIKAYLMAYGLPVPFIHNLEKMLELCEQHDASFSQVKTLGQALTPYAVQLRYDEEFWPPLAEAASALQSAQALCAFIVPRLPTASSLLLKRRRGHGGLKLRSAKGVINSTKADLTLPPRKGIQNVIGNAN